jgi:hypothetical protein
MSKSKKILVVGGAFLVGAVFLVMGWSELRASQKLVAEGKAATADVLSKETKRGRKGRRSYYLNVQFKTESGAQTQQRLPVSSSEFDNTGQGGTVPVRYLPSDPSVCQVGDKAEAKWGGLVVGLSSWVVGTFLAFAKKDEEGSDEASSGTDSGPEQDAGGQDLPKAA